jgi:hypothetical protein
MPTLRERRSVKHPKRFEFKTEQSYTRWPIGDKKKVLLALKKYGEEDIHKIQAEFLPQKTFNEICFFINRMKRKAQSRPQIPRTKVPIELWCEMANDLTATSTDVSYLLAEVFSKIEKNELHDPKSSREAPDWKLIYNYLVMLLNGHELPDVGQIEAGVLLDLLEALACHLKQLNVTDQRCLMEAKYSLLATEVGNTSSKRRVYDLSRRALEDDLLQPPPVSQNAAANTASTDTASTSHGADLVPSTESVPQLHQQQSEKDSRQLPGNGQEQHSVDGGSGSRCQNEPVFVLKSVKMPLYSINPFCIPVKYLNPKTFQTGATGASS